MGKKLLSIIMSVALLFGTFGMAFATDVVTTSAASGASDFSDMPDNWSTAALNKAVDNGLLSGYVESGKKLIKAGNSLTRAEMAAVVNRAFASEKTADISKVGDVSSSAWYAKDMAKAVKMGTFAYSTKMRPGDKITRQEAFSVLARAFKLVGTDSAHKALNAFSDKGEIASWALNSLDGMAAAGYIQGSGGKLNPTANITRAEFAVVMDNLVKDYIDVAGDVTEVVAKGNVVVRVPGVTLKNVTVKGDLIIADGVDDGDVTLDNVKVEGRTVVRGGGENSIVIKGGSQLGRVIVAKVDGVVRVFTEGGAEVEVIFVDDGSDDVIVEGKFGSLEVAGDDVTVHAKDANISNATVSGDNSKIIVGDGSKVKNGNITGDSSAIVVDKGGSVDTVTISGPNASVGGEGEVKKVEVKEGVEGTEVGGKPVEGGQTVDGSGAPATPTPSTYDDDDDDYEEPSIPPTPQVSAITAKVNGEESWGPFDNTFKVTVTLETGTEGAEIYYTLDGTTPSESDGEKYNEGGIEITAADNYGGMITLKAVAIADNHKDSEILTKYFVFKPDVEITVSGLTKDYYVAEDTLEFTISGLRHDESAEDIEVNIRILTGEGGYPFFEVENILKNMVKEKVNGELTISGEVLPDLPSGELCITLPDYGHTMENYIPLGVYVGEPPAPTTYTVTVIGGIGGGDFEEGATVTITADTAEAGKVFDKWTSSDGVTFADASAAETTFTMLARAVTVEATYKAKNQEQAKADFLATLAEEAGKITVADVEIAGENITVTFQSDANVSAVYQAASELLTVFKEELEEASMTISRSGESTGQTFNLNDSGVVEQVAGYLLNGQTPAEFLAQRDPIEASYTATATDKHGVSFELAGALTFAVEATVAKAKADFLATLAEEAGKITVADVEIAGENITVTFQSDANVSAVYQAASELLTVFKEELEEASMTITRSGESTGQTFNLNDSGVVEQVAGYLLNGQTPAKFLAQGDPIEATYTASAKDKYGVEFTLGGNLTFAVQHK